ncbi:glyoxalase domain-containing protein 4 [Eurytemora carolleeae]|uniref:glyoxalase domain-containing protein 4 n=1 Tax=Eurytemora carolleeae TaxID=1294199 RepID=UPI000C779604|nr:glyoxalase domain-containing protein 4 [Eurytemora carolleeae]|eukprot:XP_023320657.1 glyoxalase domain-containing protein 4-like [Eurytemora affinis]
MKVLRHEEFEKGCEAACNGPYDGRWSKTMIGYGPEDSHFVLELTYNYNINSYKLGNDFQGITIQSSEVLSRARAASLPVTEKDGVSSILSPSGYKFILVDQPQPVNRDPVLSVGISVSNIEKSVLYWKDLLGMQVVQEKEREKTLQFGSNQAKLVLKQGLPNQGGELQGLEAKVQEAGGTILTPYITLDTPGKAQVQVVILADPDGQEICFVGDEGFKDLSQFDPLGDELLIKAMDEDKSDEWFNKKGRTKLSE